MYFGIRFKVALLVLLATAASALPVAKVVSERASEILRQHELVDLADEASLRGWEISGQFQGLFDDIFDLKEDAQFAKLVAEGADQELLLEKAKGLGRRYWKEHLRVDIVRLENGKPVSTSISEKAGIDERALWFPPANTPAGEGIHHSSIQRILVTRKDIPNFGEIKRWEPAIWAIAPLRTGQFDENSPPTYVRILMTFYNDPSPRHFFALETMRGELLVRHDEIEPIKRGNDKIFHNLGDNPKVKEAFQKSIQIDPESGVQRTKVDRLVLSDLVKLENSYYFQEGVPGPDLTAAIVAQPEEDFEEFYDKLMAKSEGVGRIGGLRSEVREVRILAQTEEKLEQLKDIAKASLIEEYGDAFEGIKWRRKVECDEIRAWTVRLLIGDNPMENSYLLHYAMMDDELASSIAHEMSVLSGVAALIAGGFGVIGFIIAMYFVRPLQKITLTAQEITDSEPEKLYDKLGALARGLDIKRRDEVGDIARSSKRLFEELIEFHEKLEQRVTDRTIELSKTNSELENANDKLMSLSHEKDAFVAKVSHDLRQPLNAIFLQVEALKLSELDELQKDDVQRIHDHAARELNLVNDILEYQKIIMGAESLTRDTVNIAQMLEDLGDAFRPGAEAKGIGYVVAIEPDIGHLIADDRRLRQILGNLINNACKFTKKGAVTVSAKSLSNGDADWVEFSVADTGRGMSPQEQSKIFEPFVSNKKDNAGGSGLGLSICKELTTQMGGRIGFVSELGGGTNFTIALPREPKSKHYLIGTGTPDTEVEALHEDGTDIPVRVKDLNPSSAAPAQKTGNILVIDDNDRVREVLRQLLETEGYTVSTARDGRDGLKKAKAEKPDAITLDVVMPGGIDGWEVLRELKETPETEAIPVVMVTVENEDDHKIALDVEDYLVKPVDVSRLGRVISRVTRKALQRNLLLVDDEEDSLQSLSRVLKKAGWQTTLANNGREAIAALGITRPAAIVLDLMMPEMDGFEFLAEMRQNPHLQSIPVIVMTGKTPSEAEYEFLMSCGTSVLSKGPDSSRELLDCIYQKIREK